MNKRDRGRYLTKDQADNLQPKLLAGLATVCLRMSQSRAKFKESDEAMAIASQIVEGMRYDLNEAVIDVLGMNTRKHIP